MATGDTALRLTKANSEKLLITSGIFDFNEAYTVAGWFYLTNDSEQGIISLGPANAWNNSDAFQLRSAKYRLLSYKNSVGGTWPPDLGAPSYDQWMYVALVRTSNTSIELHVDGSLLETLPTAVSGRTAAAEFSIGFSEAYYAGLKVKHLKVWTRGLTAAELLAESQQGAPVDPTDLWGYWPLDDGDVSDHSGNNRDFTAYNTPTVEEGPGIPLGTPSIQVFDYSVAAVPTPDYTGAAVFDGSTNRLERLTDLPEFNDPHTLSIWVKTDAIGVEQQIFHLTFLARTYNRADHLRIDTDGTLQCDARNNTATAAINSTETLSANTWYHIALVRYSSTSLKVFLDGVEVIDQTADMSGRASTLYLDVAAYYSGTAQAFLEGRMYGLTILAQSSTAAEVVSLMHSVKPNRANLYGFYPYLLEDKSGNSRDLTEVGTILRDHDLPDVAWTKPLPLYFDDTDYSVAAPTPDYTGAAVFDGGTNYGEITSNLPGNDTDYTLAGWINLDNLTGNKSIWSQYEHQNNYDTLDCNNENIRLLSRNGGNIYFRTGTIALVADTWHHVAMVKEDNEFSLYVDGVNENIASGTQTVQAAPVSMRFASSRSDVNPFEGSMFGFSLQKRALSDSEIIRQSQQVRPLGPDIAGFWPYILDDQSGNSRDLTEVGTILRDHDLPDVSWNKPQALQFAEYHIPQTYTFTIGSGGDYATLALWETARATASLAGDTERAEMLDGSHAGTFNFNGWTEGVNVEIVAQNGYGNVIATTYATTTGSTAPRSILTEGIKFVRSDSFYFTHTLRENFSLTFRNCSFDQEDSVTGSAFRTAIDGTGYTRTTTVENCQFIRSVAGSGPFRMDGSNGTHNIVIRGCSLNGDRIDTRNATTLDVEGCLINLASWFTNGTTTRTMVDCISNLTSPSWETETNCSFSKEFVFGTPAADQVGWRHPLDLTLIDDSNNLAIDYWTNGTLTASGITGVARPDPANAGAYEAVTTPIGFRGAAVFDADPSKYLETASNLPSIDEDYTVAGWIKLDDLTGTKSIWTLNGGQNDHDTFEVNNQRLRIYSKTGGINYFADSGGNELSADTWHHVALVRSGIYFLLYVDGVNFPVAGTQSQTGRDTPNIMQFARRNVGLGDAYFEGNLYGFSMHQRALTSNEVSRQAHQTKPIGPNIIGFWPYIGEDKSGNSRDLTETGIITRDHATPSVAWTKPQALQFADYAVAGVAAAPTPDYTGAAVFDDSSDWCEITSDVMSCESDYTICGFWKPPLSGGNGAIMHLGVAGANRMDAIEVISGQLKLLAYNGSDLINANGSTTFYDAWGHVCLRRTGNTLDAFLDGVLQVTGTVATGVRAATDTMRLASHVDLSGNGTGNAYGWAAWTRALSTSEIQRQSTQVSPVDATDLYEFWPNARTGERLGRDWTENGTITRSHDLPDVSWTKPLPLYFDDTDYSVAATPAYDFGIRGAAVFDGSTTYVERAVTTLDYNSTYTVSGRFKFDGTGNRDGLLSLYDSARSYYDSDLLYRETDDKLSTYAVASSSGTTVQQTSTVTSGVWYHIAMVRYSDTSLKVYLDGAEIIENTQDISGRSAVAWFDSGAFYTFDDHLDGNSFGLTAWTRALSASEIKRQSLQTSPVDPTSLYGFWPYLLDDQSGNSRDLTELGTILRDHDLPDVSWTKPQALQFADYAVAGVATPAFLNASYGTARHFDNNSFSVGTYAYFSVLSEGLFPIGAGSTFTVSFWVRVEAIHRGEHMLWSARPNSGNSQDTSTLLMDTDGHVVWRSQLGYSYVDVSSTSVLGDNVWTHVAIRRVSDDLSEIVINGVVDGTDTQDGSSKSTSTFSQNWVGGNRNSEGMTGSVANLMTHGHALSDSELIRQSQQVLATDPDVIGHWPLYENAGESYQTGLVGGTLTWHASSEESTSTDGPGIAWTKPLPLYFDDTDYSVAATPAYDFGTFGAAVFDGSTNYLRRTTDTLDHNAPYTISLWFKADSTTGNKSLSTVFAVTDDHFNADRIRVDDGIIRFTVWGSGVGGSFTGGTVSTGTWHHIVATREGDAIAKCYLDGILIITNTHSIAGRAASYQQDIGVYGTTGEEFDGRMYGLTILEESSTASEVSKLMSFTKPDRANVHGFWPTMLEDHSGNGRDLTEAGTILRDHDLPDVSWTKPIGLFHEDNVFIGGSSDTVLNLLTTPINLY